MTETYLPIYGPETEVESMATDVQNILDGYSPEAILAAANLMTQLPHMVINEGGELTPRLSEREQIIQQIGRVGSR